MDNEKNINAIKQKLLPIFQKYHIKRAVLFGSQVSGQPDAQSDVDLLVDSGLKGLEFVGLMEEIRQTLDCELDLFDTDHIEKESKIAYEINESGMVIYEEPCDYN